MGARQPARSRERLTILVVDDLEMNRKLLRVQLTAAGHLVLESADGQQALQMLRSNGLQRFAEHQGEIQLVLTEIGFPKVDGTSVVGVIREMGTEVPIVVTSGFIEPDARIELEELGIDEIMQKPYEVQTVLRCVRGILDRRLDRSRGAES